MHRRGEILSLINFLEKDYDVNSYEYCSHKIWPLIRIRLFFYLIFKTEKHSKEVQEKDNNLFRRFCALLESTILFVRLLLTRKRITTLYAGSHFHRIRFRGSSFNRFHDVLMDQFDDDTVMLAEYHDPASKLRYYKPHRVLEIFRLYPFFYHASRARRNDGFNKELKGLLEATKNEIANRFSITFDLNKFSRDLSQELTTIFVYRDIFRFVFKRFKVKKAIGLCYYATPMFGMDVAAHELGIGSADYQHGPQGEYHLGYTNWNVVPKEGYTLLPSDFLCWNEGDSKGINAWAMKGSGHKASVQGNCWVELWKTGKISSTPYTWPKNIILYTLQPVENCFAPYLVETIKETASTFSWWIRLHPRQFHEKAIISQQLLDAGVLHVVNLEEATEFALPEILIRSSLHITKFSGSFLEATEFKVPSIIIDQRGKDYLGPFIDEKNHRVVLDKNKTSLLNAINDLVKSK